MASEAKLIDHQTPGIGQIREIKKGQTFKMFFHGLSMRRLHFARVKWAFGLRYDDAAFTQQLILNSHSTIRRKAVQ